MESEASAPKRIYAWLIDGLLLLGLWVLLAGSVLAWAGNVAYILLRDGLFDGQSLGKRIVGLKVVGHQHQRPCTYRESILRNVLWVIPVVNVVMGLTGLHALMHDPNGRHWGDRLAETVVVKA
jgi:uncharacterized RDD family membrane protein YckC